MLTYKRTRHPPYHFPPYLPEKSSNSPETSMAARRSIAAAIGANLYSKHYASDHAAYLFGKDLRDYISLHRLAGR